MAQTKIKQKQLEQITSSNITDAIANSAIPANKLSANVTDTELGYLSGVTSAIQAQIAAKLDSGILKKTTDNPDWTSDLIAVTAKAIAAKIQTEIGNAQIGGSMIFKGAWSEATINSSVKAGWTYVYDSGTPPTGHTLELGDMLIATVDNPGTSTADNWRVVQSNINGAVTYIGSAVSDGGIVVYDGTTGRLIKGNTLNGLLKLINGIPAVANASDLPSHNHRINIYNTTEQQFLDTGDTIKLLGGGIVNVIWNQSNKALNITADVSVSNGTSQTNKYVSGMSVTGGVITLTFGDLPTIPNKNDWKTGITPTGTLNGSNRIFNISESIVLGTEEVIVNGQILTRGVDYTISASTITLATDAYIPINGDVIRVNYVKA